MRNVWVTVYDNGKYEYNAHSNEEKARAWARERLESVRKILSDEDNSNMVEFKDGIVLTVYKADGSVIPFEVKIMKLGVR